MNRRAPLLSLLCVLLRCVAGFAGAQAQPYLGFAYAAGGQQGTTFEVRLGGQGLDGVHSAVISGSGVEVRLVEYFRRLINQETQLLNEQAAELKMKSPPDETAKRMAERIEKRVSEHVQTPACNAIATLALLEVTIAKDAAPGRREIRLVTDRGISNPLAFHVGQLPEFVRRPMQTTRLQTLGKEGQSLRERPPEEMEARISLPCTVNDQIAPSELNRYRFTARKGQRLVICVLGRALVPFIADAVPGWFQPVLTVHDAAGREVAFADDYHFRPAPVLFFEVPRDGEFTFTITDNIYRGREDFVYRITAGELPFITSVFSSGWQSGEQGRPVAKGWNLEKAAIILPPRDAPPGTHDVMASTGGILSLVMPVSLDTLADTTEREPNDTRFQGQQVSLPVIVNGRIEKPGDADVFRFTGKANDLIVAEVTARRLDSPLDSIIRLTDLGEKVLAMSDDREDLCGCANTHHADSHILYKLPADGTFCLRVRDTTGHGGEAFIYRLRLSLAQPGFDLRTMTSSVRMKAGESAPVTVLAQRRDGYVGPITLTLANPPASFTADPVMVPEGKNSATLNIKSHSTASEVPAVLRITGRAPGKGKTEITAEAVPCDDRMQAFLWRQLLPADELRAVVFDPKAERKPARPAPVHPRVAATTAPAATTGDAKPKFTAQRDEARLRELKCLYEDGYLTDEFHLARAAECTAGL